MTVFSIVGSMSKSDCTCVWVVCHFKRVTAHNKFVPRPFYLVSYFFFFMVTPRKVLCVVLKWLKNISRRLRARTFHFPPLFAPLVLFVPRVSIKSLIMTLEKSLCFSCSIGEIWLQNTPHMTYKWAHACFGQGWKMSSVFAPYWRNNTAYYNVQYVQFSSSYPRAVKKKEKWKTYSTLFCIKFD